MCHVLFIQSSADAHLGCFSLFVIVKNAAMTWVYKDLLEFCFPFFRYITKEELQDGMVILCWIFCGIAMPFSTTAAAFYILTPFVSHTLFTQLWRVSLKPY